MSRVGIRGDFGGLSRFRKQIAALAGEGKQKLYKALAEEARTQVVLGFEQERDPYGTPWKPLAAREGKILQDTGRLKNSFSQGGAARTTPRGFTISTNVKYAATHQYGATIKAKVQGQPLKFKVPGGWRSKYKVTIPARPFIPEKGLGPIWSRAMAAATGRFFKMEFPK